MYDVIARLADVHVTCLVPLSMMTWKRSPSIRDVRPQSFCAAAWPGAARARPKAAVAKTVRAITGDDVTGANHTRQSVADPDISRVSGRSGDGEPRSIGDELGSGACGQLERVAARGAGHAHDDRVSPARGGRAYAADDAAAAAQFDGDRRGGRAPVAKAEPSSVASAVAVGGEAGGEQLAIGAGLAGGTGRSGSTLREHAARALEPDPQRRRGVVADQLERRLAVASRAGPEPRADRAGRTDRQRAV